MSKQREIKFKGLRSDGQGWVFGDLIHSAYSNGSLYDSIRPIDSDVEYAIAKESPCQYTGLQDCEGVNVFEGDLWKRDTFVGIVTFEYGGWNFKQHETSECYQYPSFYSNVKTGEVVGNIHDKESEAK